MILLRKARRRLRRLVRPDALDLTGDRQVEWAFVAGQIPERASAVLDFGCGNAPVGLVAALKGLHVLAIDLGQVQWFVAAPTVEFVQADVIAYDFGSRRFDVILNCSTVEHVGLAGRYGSIDDDDGDLKAMARLRQLLEPGGKMLMTIPIGQDQVCRPLHRIYGPQRFPRLVDGYSADHAEYWVKRGTRNVWVPCDVAEAYSVRGGPGFYALGLFVLTCS